MSRIASTADFLASRRNTMLLLLADTGERLWLGFAPKYLKTLGATGLAIRLFDALQTLLGARFMPIRSKHCLAGRGVRSSRLEGIRRTGAQGAHHRSGRA